MVASGDNSIAIHADSQAVLDDDSIDIIDVCLPPHLHFDVTLAGLKAGKHVICEKPLVRSVREVDVLIDAATEAQRQVFPVFQYRYGHGLHQLQALIHAGLAGKPYAASLETHWNRDSDYYAVAWRGTWTGESGGAVLGHAIHNHDLLTYVMGPIRSLSAITTTRVNPIEVEDCAAISLRWNPAHLPPPPFRSARATTPHACASSSKASQPPAAPSLMHRATAPGPSPHATPPNRRKSTPFWPI